MAESLNHITYVRRIVEYAKDIPSAFIPNCLLADLPDFPERPIATLDGYIFQMCYITIHIQ